MKSTKEITHGFGVPNVAAPHQFIVRITAGRSEPVEVWEDLGAISLGLAKGNVCRAVLPRSAWNQVAEAIRGHLNSRLREKGIKGSRFATGDNRVERILGRELCVLAWAIEDAAPEDAAGAIKRWQRHAPEELWWLFQQVERDGGEWDSPRTGWRAAIRQALVIDERVAA